MPKEVKSNASDKALPSSDLRGRHCFQTAPQRLALPTSPGLMQDTATFVPFMSSMVCSDYCSPTSFSQAQCFIWKTMKPNRNHCNDIVDVGLTRMSCTVVVEIQSEFETTSNYFPTTILDRIFQLQRVYATLCE